MKVLDFGLAKALEPDGVRTRRPDAVELADAHDARMRPQMGMILGTAAYMAPEQARGKSVDRRADIWAFGVVLYEMLTGRRAFEGEEISDVLAAVLRQDIDWTALPRRHAPAVRRLLKRCLEKDPRKRLSAIGDARLELDEPEPAAAASAPPVAARPSIAARLWPAVAGVVLTAVLAALLWPKSPASRQEVLTRLSVLPAAGREISIRIRPASRFLPTARWWRSSSASVTRSETQLWVRSLDSTDARRLDDADGASLPFWSPDSRRIGFFADGKLKTIAVTGGRAEVLCDAPGGARRHLDARRT